jgi:lysophospholipase L1-like esterase
MKTRLTNLGLMLLSAVLIFTGTFIATSHFPAYGAAGKVPDQPVRILTLGDSITAGIRDPAGNGYRCTLKAYLAAQGMTTDFVGSLSSGTCGDIEHEGHSGWTTGQILEIAADRVITYQPDIVILMAGTNDLKPENKASVTGLNDRLAAIIDAIHAARPQTVVIVSTIPAYPAADQVAWKKYRGDVPTIAMQHGAVTAYGNNVLAKDLADGVHPNAGCGYIKLASYIDGAVIQAAPSPNGRTWAPVWPMSDCS